MGEVREQKSRAVLVLACAEQTMGQGLSLVVAIGLPVAGGVLGSIYTVPAVKKWYPTLKKPSWTPPNWLFGPVWTALYTMMGIAKKLGLALANITALGVAVGITSHAFYA